MFAFKGSIKIVPLSENWLVERLGKYNQNLDAGLHLTIPFFESVRYKVQIQERQLPPKPINVITHDNVTIVNGMVRSVLGKIDLDGVQSNRRHLANEIETELQEVSEEWGVKLTRVEITEVDVDDETKSAMQQQLNAERKRRGSVTEAEGRKRGHGKENSGRRRSLCSQFCFKAIADGGASAVEFEIKKIQAHAIQELSKGTNSKIVLVPSDVLSSLSGTIGCIASKL